MISKFEVVSNGIKIRGELHFPEIKVELYKTVIVLTGDTRKGFNGFSVQRLLPEFLSAGNAVCLFDFMGLGTSDGERRNLKLTDGINNFRDVFSFLLAHQSIDKDNIIIFATSFGATVVLSSPEIVNKAKRCILRSPCVFLAEAYINEIGNERFLEWRKTNYCDENDYYYSVLLDSLRYNVYAECTKIITECFIVYGGKDEIVPSMQTLLLYDLLAVNKEIREVVDANHGYSGEGCFDQLLAIIREWL